MTETFYIDGVEMEQSAGAKPASLVFQSLFFTDLESVTGNRTNTVNFPATRGNLNAVGNPDITLGVSYPYRKHKASCFRDGLKLFSGTAVLTSVSKDKLTFVFTWGNVTAFSKMMDLRIRDFQTDEDDVSWDVSSLHSSDKPYDGELDWGVGPRFPSSGTPLYVGHPYVRVSDLLTRIQQRSGVTLQGTSVLEDLVIPCIGREPSDYTRRWNAARYTSGALSSSYTYSAKEFRLMRLSENDDDHLGWATGDQWQGLLDVSGVETLGIYAAASSLYLQGVGEKQVVNPSTGQMAWMDTALQIVFELYGCNDETGEDAVLLKSFTSHLNITSDQVTHVKTATLATAVNEKLDVSNYDYVCIRFFQIASSSGRLKTTTVSNASLFLFDADQSKVTVGERFPLYTNLPDWTAGQLLKNLMRIRGLFAMAVNDSTLKLISLEDLYRAKVKAPDWGGIVQLRQGRPDEISFKFGNLARSNKLAYAEDESVTGSYDGVMPTDNEALEDETELVRLDFAATDMRGGHPIIRAYAQTEDDDEPSVDFSEVTPRVLRLTGTTNQYGQDSLTFAGLDWPALLGSSYARYAAIALRPRVEKCQVYMEPLLLAGLDLTVPVYLSQRGRFYAILKLTTKDARMADVELLRLG